MHNDTLSISSDFLFPAQSTGPVEYTDGTSAEK